MEEQPWGEVSVDIPVSFAHAFGLLIVLQMGLKEIELSLRSETNTPFEFQGFREKWYACESVFNEIHAASGFCKRRRHSWAEYYGGVDCDEDE